MLPITGVLALARSPVAIWLGAAVGLTALLAGAYLAIDSRAVARCEREHGLAAIHAQDEAHQAHLAAIERGDKISRKLLETQRKLRSTEHEYLTYANAITGVCDPNFGVFVAHASGGQAGMPQAPGASATAPAPQAPADSPALGRAVAANIAINYARLDACVAQQNALIDWHEEVVK